MAPSTIVEIEPTHVPTHGSKSNIRNFRLTTGSSGGFTVELSCLGASITKLLVPNYANDEAQQDDIVLSYASPLEQYDDKNAPYFGCIVGRVANRIRQGRFDLDQRELEETVSYQLDRNNGANHLHGGYDGFGYRVWEAEIVEEEETRAVRFTLISPDGDQGYPGAIQVVAEYSLVEVEGEAEAEAETGVKLCLSMRASLLSGETNSTPIALANHTYFNLAGHSHHAGILDHVLCMPNCHAFTPVDDDTLIPTRAVQPVDIDGEGQPKATCMDFRIGKSLGDSLVQYGREKAGLSQSDSTNNIVRRKNFDGAVARAVPKKDDGGGSSLDASTSTDNGEPYGFDHNYVINHGSGSVRDRTSLTLAAILSHPPTRRSMRVFTSASGLQLYTSNYLDGTNPMPQLCKDSYRYDQWQGICLETQSYPDSIYRNGNVVPEKEIDFAKGRCFIMHPGGEEYSHCVEYLFGEMK